MTDLTLQNSPFWTSHFIYSHDIFVKVRALVLRSIVGLFMQVALLFRVREQRPAGYARVSCAARN